MDRISIVVPCFNEEEALPVYYREMKNMEDVNIYLSPETLEKKQLYTRDLNMQVETMWRRWT